MFEAIFMGSVSDLLSPYGAGKTAARLPISICST